MRYNLLGRTGVQVSRVALGTAFFGTRIDPDRAAQIFERALDLGINTIDTAESYLRPQPHASETVLGRLIPSRRDEIFLATKINPGRSWEAQVANRGLSRRVVVQAAEGSLRRLQTDYLDLLYTHGPDPHTALDETLAALDDLVRAGKVRYAGLSNVGAVGVVEALWMAERHALRPIAATQDLYNLLARGTEADLYPVCARHGLGAFAYAPLQGGLLTGKYTPEMVAAPDSVPVGWRASYYGATTDETARASSQPKLTPNAVAAAQRLEGWAADRGHTAAQVALAWAATGPAVSAAILGVTAVDQLDAIAPAFDLEFSAADRADVAAAVDGPTSG